VKGYTIPLFDLNYGEAERKALARTLDSRWISMGPNVKCLEERFQEHLSVKNAVVVNSCTAALHLALKILGIKEGDEVIVPSLTFVATVNAVKYVGATPVFVDIASYDDLSIDPDDIDRKITGKTKAIMPMHYGGFPCDMDRIVAIAKAYGLFIIEDAAHAPDSQYKGRKLGTIGDFGCFSLFSNKNITCGEGGVLVTQNDEYDRRARLLRSHGMTTASLDRATGHATTYDVVELGYNYRMDDIRGALALTQLDRLKADIEKRRVLRECYLEELGQVDDIIVPYTGNDATTSNYIFPIVLRNGNATSRNMVRQRLAHEGIETSIHYPAVHRFSIYRQFDSDLPKTNYVTDNEITLPLFYRLTVKEIQYICDMLKKVM
jgi:dTDP-4-amino-4,6-dideoxygalactose transaminase